MRPARLVISICAILTGCRGPQAHVVPVFISGIGDNLWDEICKNFSDRQ